MSTKKKNDGQSTDAADASAATGTTPQKRIAKGIKAATDALSDAQAYLDSAGFTWIELAQKLRPAQEAAQAAWGIATRESLRPTNQPEEG